MSKKPNNNTEGDFQITEDSLVYTVEVEDEISSPQQRHLREPNENYLKYLIRKTIKNNPNYSGLPYTIVDHIKDTYKVMCTYNDVKAVFDEDGIKLRNSWSTGGHESFGWEDEDDYAIMSYY